MAVKYTRKMKGKKFIIEAEGLGIEEKIRTFGGKRCERVKFAWLRKHDAHTIILDDGNDWEVEASGWMHGGFASERSNVESAASSFMRDVEKWDRVRGIERLPHYQTMIVEIQEGEVQ